MRTWFRQLDDLLRGRKTATLLADKVDVPLRLFVPLAIALGAVYGWFMGWYAFINRDPALYVQMLASAVKIPLLFLATLVVTFPSLYVFSALLGSRLSFHSTLRLLVGSVVVNLAVAASFGPVLGFFTLTTQSYQFMVLLNVVLLAIAGLVALGFLLRSLRRLIAESIPVSPPVEQPHESYDPASTAFIRRQEAPSLPESTDRAKSIFRVWVMIYALVGAQMSWLLRPFIGSPSRPFSWFRPRGGNFFESVLHQLQSLLTL